MMASRRSRGAVLVIGMIVLAIMTVVGLASMRGSVLEERMAGNLKQQNVAIQSAEAALQAALGKLAAHRLNPAAIVWPTGTGGTLACKIDDPNESTKCSFLADVLDNWQSASPTMGTSIKDLSGVPLASASVPQPRAIVEWRRVCVREIDLCDQGLGFAYFFTITAVGTDISGQARAVLQTTVEMDYF